MLLAYPVIPKVQLRWRLWLRFDDGLWAAVVAVELHFLHYLLPEIPVLPQVYPIPVVLVVRL